MKKEYNIKVTTQPMHKGAMAALFLKKAYDEAYSKLNKFPSNEEVIKFMEGLKWDTPSGEAVMALGNGHQAIQDQAIGKSKWNSDKKRVEIVKHVCKQACQTCATSRPPTTTPLSLHPD